jgi:hypothetical protein
MFGRSQVAVPCPSKTRNSKHVATAAPSPLPTPPSPLPMSQNNTEADAGPSAPSSETGTTAQLPVDESPALKFLAKALGTLIQGQSLQQSAMASQKTDLHEQLRLQHEDTQRLLAQIGGATTSSSSGQACGCDYIYTVYTGDS